MLRCAPVVALALLAAYASGVPGTISFDGVDCVYSGAAQFDPSENVILEFRNDSVGEASLLTFRIRTASSLVDLVNAAATTSASALIGGGQMDVPSAQRLDVPPGQASTTSRRMDTGHYAVACLTESNDRLFIADRIQVGAP